ncbi:class I SAM-dependent methyltransferase [Palaeococcus ferrophilus]|uniref:class I SAM-dependent methyltransferase n=1 Tax=Palaeococcus ferrophilus TaxID=83868 RepID=UPI00064E72B9|nr:class I SAM-dependent methyltransferase [Palaeococcus ferrophilus]
MSFREKYAKLARYYDLLERPLDRFFCPLRERAISFVEGPRVLEVGVGVGKTLKYYPRGVELHAVDAVPEALKIAEGKAKKLGLKAHFQVMEAEGLEFPDGYFDTVVSSFVFCTVPEPRKAMEEIRRVLKQGGRAVFLEHTRSDSSLVDWLFLRPMKLILKPLLDDDPLRETHRLVREYFNVEHEESYYRGVVRLIVARKV